MQTQTGRMASVLNDDDERSAGAKTLAALARVELAEQIRAAHKYKRDLKAFIPTAVEMATVSQDVAEACLYTVLRKDRHYQEICVVGPSVRLAEICASVYGNLRSSSRISDEGETFIEARGIALDLERNTRFEVEVRRFVPPNQGRARGEVVATTSDIILSIALRNVILKAIPKVYVDEVFKAVKAVAIGTEKTLPTRREEVIARLQELGVSRDRVLARFGKTLEEVTLSDLALLIGLATSIRDGAVAAEEAFPVLAVAPVPMEEGKRVSVVAPPVVPSAAPSPAVTLVKAHVQESAKETIAVPAEAPAAESATPTLPATPAETPVVVPIRAPRRTRRPPAAAAEHDPETGEVAVPEGQLKAALEDSIVLDAIGKFTSVESLKEYGVQTLQPLKEKIGEKRYAPLRAAYLEAKVRIESAAPVPTTANTQPAEQVGA